MFHNVLFSSGERISQQKTYITLNSSPVCPSIRSKINVFPGGLLEASLSIMVPGAGCQWEDIPPGW